MEHTCAVTALREWEESAKDLDWLERAQSLIHYFNVTLPRLLARRSGS